MNYLTHADLVELQQRIYDGTAIRVTPRDLDALQRAHVRERRHGVTRGGIPWTG